MGYLSCGIYERRPAQCERYPERDSYVPEECTYTFDAEGNRQGECDSECQASCCCLPRHQGEPTGPGMPEIAGGLPCKHLKYANTHPSMSSDGKADPVVDGDRGEDQQESNPVELALAEIDRRKRDRAGAAALGIGGRAREGSKEG